MFMAISPDGPKPKPIKLSLTSVLLALVPVLALTVGIPFANRLEPRILGLPFLLAWIVSWIILTPMVMATIHWLDGRRQ